MKAIDFVKNVMKYSVPTVVSALVGVLVIPIITRIFPTSEYGKINMFYSMGTMLASLFFLGLSNACVRYFYEPIEGTKKEQTFNFACSFGLAVTVSVGGIVILFARRQVSHYLFGETNIVALVLFFLYIGCTIVYRLQSNYARLSHKAGLFNAQQIVYIISNKILFVIVAWYSTNYFCSIAIITIAMLLEILILGRKSLRFRVDYPHKEARKQFLKFAIPLLPKDIAVMLNNSVAKLVLSAHGDFSSLGILSMATNLASIFNLVSNAFSVYWGSFMYENYQKEQKMIRKIHNVVLMLSVFMVAIIFAFQDVLYLVLGQNYRSSQPYFLLIMLMPIQLLICETTGYGINFANKTYINMYVSLFACVGNFVITFLCYPIIGVCAMALGIGFSAVFQMVAITGISQKYYTSIESWWQSALSGIVLCSLCICNLWMYDQVVARLVVAAVTVVIMILIFNKEISYVITQLRIRYVKRKANH